MLNFVAERLGELRLDLVEAGSLGLLEPHAGVARLSHETLDDASLGGLQSGEGGARGQCLEPLVDRSALGEAKTKSDHLALDLGMSIPEGVAVLHAHQVTDQSPRVAETVRHRLEPLDQTAPGRLEVGLERGELLFERLEQGPDPGTMWLVSISSKRGSAPAAWSGFLPSRSMPLRPPFPLWILWGALRWIRPFTAQISRPRPGSPAAQPIPRVLPSGLPQILDVDRPKARDRPTPRSGGDGAVLCSRSEPAASAPSTGRRTRCTRRTISYAVQATQVMPSRRIMATPAANPEAGSASSWRAATASRRELERIRSWPKPLPAGCLSTRGISTSAARSLPDQPVRERAARAGMRPRCSHRIRRGPRALRRVASRR